MTLRDLLSLLRDRNITVWADGDRLHYSAPSGALTPDLRDELAKHKVDILTLLRETERIRQWNRGPITRIAREGPLLPSINQRRLWFIDQLQPNTAFNCAQQFRINGSLNIDSLKKSINEIVRRHEILRTTIAEIDGEPRQTISPVSKLELSIVDLRCIGDHVLRNTEAERIVTEEMRSPFDLAKGPLFRAQLVQLEREEYLLLFVTHHIVTDAWSIGILFKELTVLYEAYCKGRSSSLPELPIQYADFADWQSRWMEGEALQQELSYWEKQLRGAPEVTGLLTDYSRPEVQSFQGASEPLLICKNLTDALKALSKTQGVTLFMTLLAAFKTLLYRYTGQEDLVVGSPIAGRIRVELENLIGLFINTLVLRTDLSGNPSFRELLRRTREAALNAYGHQNVPIERLMQALHLERSRTFSPLFQVMFVLHNSPPSELKLLDCRVRPVSVKRETTLFDLFLSLAERDEELHGILSYRTELFGKSTISRMIDQFQVLLHGIVANPDQQIATLPLLTEKEEHQLLVEWNNTNGPYLGCECVHQLFEEQVARTPGAIAVIAEAETLTYKELNDRANQLANYLRRRRVGPDIRIGICVDRSPEMLVAFLGILKAGGAYVPVDPNHPKERVAFILQDAHVPLLLTEQRVWAKLIEGERSNSANGALLTFNPQLQVICLDAEWQTIARESNGNNLSASVNADNLAYVIYTSGSTGQPKGVEITHRALTNFTASARGSLALTPSDRVLQFASINFDTAAEEIYPTLICGASLVLRTDSVMESVSAFLRFCADRGITVLDLPTAYWHELTEQISSDNLTPPAGLRLVVIGGERVAPERVAQWRAVVGNRIRLLNTYGPTEATVVTTTWELAGVPDKPLREVPIGRPIANVQTYVLDRQSNLVPIGVPGELCLGGVALARGYLNRPELTAEKFFPHPFSDDPGARLYKTGDLARYLLDGSIEFLGRIDHQVKIRGFRIEPGEIETALSQHPAVKQTVVTAREASKAGEGENRKWKIQNPKSLVAYVVLCHEAPLTTQDLRTFLKQKLPEYMLPSEFVFLDSLPLTPNGKVDRNNLPLPDRSQSELTGSFVAPRNSTEAKLAEIWARVLNSNRVGIHDNFFDIGGHSLLAVRLFAEIEKTFKTKPPLSSLFEEPTIEHLAAVITRENAGPMAAPSLVAIQPQGSKRPFFCVHEFFGDVFCYLNLARHLGQDQPFYALEPRGLDGAAEPFTDVAAMAAHYINAIRKVQPHGPYALGGLCFGGVIAFEMAQQLCAQGEPVSLVALLDSGIKSDHSKGSHSWRPVDFLAKGVPTWLTGALELNGSQWLDLVRLKYRMSRANVGSRNGNSQRSKLIDEMADLFGFTETHRKIARAQQQAMRSYRPNVYPGRLTLFRARMQPLFSSHRPDKGWSRLAAGGLDIRVVPGNHLGMLQEPHVQFLARELTVCLEKANRTCGSSHLGIQHPAPLVSDDN